MVKKLQKLSAAKSGNAQLAGTVKDSAQQIWLAGLGAFAKAQEEGGKVFEALVKEGLSLQRKTQSVAEEKISEASNRVSSMANDISSKATGQWDKLESIFEERVAKALAKLGVPSAKEVAVLVARIDELTRSVQQLGGTPAKPAARRATAATSKAAPAAKSAAKTAAKVPPKAPHKASAKTVTKTAAKAPVKSPAKAAVKASAKAA
jgi:poly(hydroxyalkanoate) granule-associated protein